METKRATPREDAESQRGGSVTRLFIGGLKYDGISDDDLKEHFGKFGTVTSVEQMTEKSTGKKRGFGFVEFEDYDSVDKGKNSAHINGTVTLPQCLHYGVGGRTSVS